MLVDNVQSVPENEITVIYNECVSRISELKEFYNNRDITMQYFNDNDLGFLNQEAHLRDVYIVFMYSVIENGALEMIKSIYQQISEMNKPLMEVSPSLRALYFKDNIRNLKEVITMSKNDIYKQEKLIDEFCKIINVNDSTETFFCQSEKISFNSNLTFEMLSIYLVYFEFNIDDYKKFAAALNSLVFYRNHIAHGNILAARRATPDRRDYYESDDIPFDLNNNSALTVAFERVSCLLEMLHNDLLCYFTEDKYLINN